MPKKVNILIKSEQENPFILSISDLMTVLMLTFALLLIGSLLLNKKLRHDYQVQLKQCLSGRDQCLKQFDACKAHHKAKHLVFTHCQDQFEQCIDAKNNLDAELKNCQEKVQNLSVLNAPQTISLKEVEGFTFDSGSGALSGNFITQLANLLKTDRVINIINNPNTKVIEIIGHTDNQPARGRHSNLDQQIVNVMVGGSRIDGLVYGSNTDLGLIRAVSVYLYLKQLQTDGLLRPDLQFRIYSAAQLALPSGRLVDTHDENIPAEQRRRIELKFEALPQAQ